ncbi:HNH endonuclease [Saccharopolyspora antimicrobica]|uniref:5-methylcytosine-specific restriction protein A n=1 Tax=Saccharopolyspora antimicrobica TaxID=455193 RepID=A0ABX9T592_9PSEU|nr:5-methylcytosine-specific restriction protein A [Saccharopolyspora antimicrobica]
MKPPKRESWENSSRSKRLPPNWRALRAQVLRRDRNTCQINGPECSIQATEVDHIQAGDNHSADNLRAVCSVCHARKSALEGSKASRIARARMSALRKRRPERHPGRRDKRSQ